MKNSHLLQRLTSIQKSLMAAHSGGQGMPNATVGTEREHFVRQFLEEIFPRPYRFGSGAITDVAGAISGQVDVVIEWPFSFSFPLIGGQPRLYLAELVVAVVEVKSDLSKQWNEVEATCAKVHALTRDLGAIISFGAGPASTTIPIFAVGYAGYATLQGLQARLASTSPERRPDGVLVIDSGVAVVPSGSASGPWGLYLVAGQLLIYTRSAMQAAPDFWGYAQ